MVSKEKIKKDITNYKNTMNKQDTNSTCFSSMFIFSILINSKKSIKSWKSKNPEYLKKSNSFIVGVQTSKGSYAQQYDKKYWDYFKCKEVNEIPENTTTDIKEIHLLTELTK